VGPRVVIAGTHSGVGKTTVATGLLAAFARRGVSVTSAKVGPDFIDPGYHALASGRVGRNLDPFLCGADAIAPLAARAATGGELLVIEGVMGLFDGVGATTEASTAEVAMLLESPVLLVVDASAMSGSVAALVHGYDDRLSTMRGSGVAGIVLNRVGSDTHESILREALETLGVPVVGVLRRNPELTWRDRHLGLVPVVEQPAESLSSIERLAVVIDASIDLDAVERVARRAPPLTANAIPAARRVVESSPRVAVAGGPAFTFCYPDNLERLREAGAELVPFDPLTETVLPDGTDGLYLCGGFPEVFAAALADNTSLLESVRARLAGGLPCWAECGGLLWLARSLDGTPLCGAIPADATMSGRVQVGYRTATAQRENPVLAVGSIARGHEHHYSTLQPDGDALALSGRAGQRMDGWATPTMLATYLHLHLGADAGPAERFISSVGAASDATPTLSTW
jgi:cobyrinic acid a,c-diamide synthase